MTDLASRGRNTGQTVDFAHTIVYEVNRGRWTLATSNRPLTETDVRGIRMAFHTLHERSTCVQHARVRAFECALALLGDFADRLTRTQLVECHIAIMAGPGAAALGLIPLAYMVMGVRV